MYGDVQPPVQILAPALGVAFTADTTAVRLSATHTAYPGGFLVQNQGATTMYIGDGAVVGVGTGIALAAGASMPVASSDAYHWWARAAVSCAGVVVGAVVP